MPSIKEILSQSSIKLRNVAQSPYKETSVLLGFSLGVDNLWLMTHENDIINTPPDFIKNIKIRAEFYPLEYILKKTSFYSKEFYTDERVLIPRPETEILIDKVVSISENLNDLTIAEIGVGSGIISVLLAILLPNAKIIATDISEDALEVAKINAKRHSVMDNIKFVNCNLLDEVDEKIDIIVSNPPYIKRDEKLERNLSYEPNIALFGGVKGDEILKKIIDESIKRKVRYLACEMGYNQREKITNYLFSYGFKARFYQDLSQIDRGFVVY